MGTDLELDETTLAQRTVLCCMVRLAKNGETPANSAEIRTTATEHADDIREKVGLLTEADIMRAMNGLAETDLVEELPADDTSPVGKGRQRYALNIDVDVVVSFLDEDGRIEPLSN